MSGLEVIGGISAVIAIIDASVKIWEGAQKDIQLPKTFVTVARRLPLLRQTLQICHDQLDAVKDTLPEDVVESFIGIVEHSETQASLLRKIFIKTIPGDNATRLERLRAAIKSVGQGKRVEQLLQAIGEDTRVLAEYHGVKMNEPDLLSRLDEMIQELRNAEPSLDEVSTPSQGLSVYNYGGQQNISTGDATHSGRGDQHVYGGVGTIQQYSGPVNQIPSRLTKEQKCHRIFKTSSYESHKDRNPNRVEHTCGWVLNHSQFQDWRNGTSHALLWISADPGCGKSVLSKSLADQDLQAGGQEKICYFFFKDNDEQDNLAVALCALLHQLFDQQPHLIRHAIPAWEKDGAGLQHECRQLWRILLSATADESAQPVICILDALDECRDSDRRQLIELLCGLEAEASRAGGKTCLKFVVTSRPYDNVQRWFNDATRRWPKIRLRGEDENEAIHEEINLVIKKRVDDLTNEFALSDKSRTKLRTQLLQMQHRTHLWLYLAIEEIREVCQGSILGNSLQIESLPSTVEEAYERILGKISKRQKADAHLILLIIVGARRTLTMREMAMAISAAKSYRTDAQELLAIDAVQLEKQIRGLCGLFVYIQQSQLFLIHQTAKEFLVTNSTVVNKVQGQWTSSMSIKLIETQMARLCMTYLYLRSYQRPSINAEAEDESSISTKMTQPNMHKADKFFKYCAENWTSHLHNEMFRGQDRLLEVALWLYRLDHLPLWFPYSWTTFSYSQPPRLQIQHAIAMFGHTAILEKLYSLKVIDLEQRDSTGRTALHWAAERGHLDLVKLLLDKNADINAEGGRHGSALQEATYQGYENVVQLLLDKGADVSAKGGEYDSALYIASERGREKMVQLLLDRGADVNTTRDGYGSALYTALVHGHEKVVQLLLDEGTDVNVQEDEHGNALYVASERGYKEVVQLLLDKGVDVNAKGSRRPSALYIAAQQGHKKVVQLLLDRGADVNAQSSALYIALVVGHEKIVQLLLDKGANINAKESRRPSALYIAAELGHEKVVQLLRDRGTNVNTVEVEYGSALQVASAKGHERVVQALLLGGAKVNLREGPIASRSIRTWLEQTSRNDPNPPQSLLIRFAVLSNDQTKLHQFFSGLSQEDILNCLRTFELSDYEQLSLTLVRFRDNGWRYVHLGQFGRSW